MPRTPRHGRARQAVHLSIEAKAQEHAPRVAQHHHEAHQRAPRAAYCQVPEVSPVHLHLLARQRAQAQVGLGRRARAHRAYQGAEVAGLARVAALADHVMQPAGRQRGVLLQGLADEAAVRIDKALAQRSARRHDLVFAQHAADRVAVHLQLTRDGPHAPVLDRVQTLDPGGQFSWDGHGRGAGQRCSGAGSPDAHGAAAAERSAGR